MGSSSAAAVEEHEHLLQDRTLETQMKKEGLFSSHSHGDGSTLTEEEEEEEETLVISDPAVSKEMVEKESNIQVGAFMIETLLVESNAKLDEVVSLAKELHGTKIKPLWGTTQLFMHSRYMHGAATSSEVGVYAYAAAQVKKAMEVTHHLGGENFLFWGGREGYQTPLNTDMKKELDHLAKFLQAAVDYKKKIGFNGTLLIELKPQEPTKHQYDWEAATTFSFLQKYGLLACHHELETARINGILGNVDAKHWGSSDCWDTNQFLTDIGKATLVMLSVIRNGGLEPASLISQGTMMDQLLGGKQKVILLGREQEEVVKRVIVPHTICHGRVVQDDEKIVWVDKVLKSEAHDGPQNGLSNLCEIADGGFVI